jgi:hypothetical protein
MRHALHPALLLLGLLASLPACSSSSAVSGCDDGTKHYAVGDMFKDSDNCNACLCTKAGLTCTTVACNIDDGGAKPDATSDANAADGGKTCEWKGQSYASGVELPNSHCDGTSTGPGGCFCDHGTVACSAVDCHALQDAGADHASDAQTATDAPPSCATGCGPNASCSQCLGPKGVVNVCVPNGSAC